MTDKLTLTGIGKGSHTTLGTINASIDIPDDLKLQHKFHVVEDKFSIDENGIIGRDFFRKYQADTVKT